ncbi:unnamed protein product [Schistosoma turkestanicum]|nr:unnamed protein product [Schistosoma turkestanicum]
MKFSLYFSLISLITLTLTAESLRHHKNDKLLRQYDDISGEEISNTDNNHYHDGVARWGEGDPYRPNSEHLTSNSEDYHETTEAKTSEEHKMEKEDKEEHTQTEQSVVETLDHQHEGIVNWGGHETEYYEEDTTVMEKTTEDTSQKDYNRTFHNDTNRVTEDMSNSNSLQSALTNISRSLPQNLNGHDHDDDHHQDLINDDNTTDSLHDKQIIDHLIDPLLSDIYVANNHSSVTTQTNIEDDEWNTERSCRKCVKWQQLQLTLPCLLYPINFDAPQQVNQTKIIYVHVMRKIIARINQSLNELLLDLEL